MKIKWSRKVELKELEEIFRQLQEGFSQGVLSLSQRDKFPLPPKAFLKATFKDTSRGLELKIRIDFYHEEDQKSYSHKKEKLSLQKEKGKEIKKLMDYLFKDIIRTTSNDKIPSLDKIEELIKLHEVYDPWVKNTFRTSWEASKKLCQKLKEESQAYQLEEVKKIILTLERLKKACHKKHK